MLQIKLWDTANTVLRVKCVALNACITKSLKLMISVATLRLEKDEQVNSKVTRRKEIVK